MPDKDHVDEDQGLTLDLCQCMGCGLVQFDCEPVDYYRDVIRAGGYSTTMAELRRKQYRHLIETYHLEGKRFIEVGCGQGEFLKVLEEFPVEGHGIEHDPALVKLARAQGLAVEQGFTEHADTVIPGGFYDVFLSFNFLEHQRIRQGCCAVFTIIWKMTGWDFLPFQALSILWITAAIMS